MGGQAVGRNVSLPVRGIRVGCVASGGKRAGTAPIGTYTLFFIDGHMAAASTGGGFLKTGGELEFDNLAILIIS